MNLLYFVPFWPHRYTPFLFREVAWMKGRGHRVAVVSMREWPDGQCNVEAYGLTDVPVLQVRHKPAGDRALAADAASLVGAGLRGRSPKPLARMRAELGVRQAAHEWVWAKKVSAFARRHGAEVVDAHWMSEAAAAARTLRQTDGVPYTVTSHGNDLGTPSLAALVGDAAGVFPIARHMARELTARLDGPPAGDTVRIRPHGIPAAVVAAAPVPQATGRLTVAMTGRIDPEKRQADLVEAVGLLAGEFPDLRLLLIGGGTLEPDLRRRADELGIADRLTITGGLPWEEVMARVREAAIYVQTSEREGFPLGPLEAASQGLPLVLSRIGAHEDIVRPGVNGLDFPAGDVPALAAAIRTLLADVELRRAMGAGALEHIRANYVFENLMPRMERMFQAVAAGQPLPA